MRRREWDGHVQIVNHIIWVPVFDEVRSYAGGLSLSSEARIRSADRGEGPESHCDQLASCLGEETAWEVM